MKVANAWIEEVEVFRGLRVAIQSLLRSREALRFLLSLLQSRLITRCRVSALRRAGNIVGMVLLLASR